MSRTALEWFVNYLPTRRQFVQVNDKQSETMGIKFGVPQGSILRPFLFNLYVNDMKNCVQDGCTCLQYADNTTVYQHSTPKDIDNGIRKMNSSLHSIETWTMDNNLLLIEKKTKQMIITTRQMSKVHNLDNIIMPHIIKGETLDRVHNFKLLRRLKNMMAQDTKKTLVQSLVLSKLNFSNPVSYSLPVFLQKKVQRVQNTAASFFS